MTVGTVLAGVGDGVFTGIDAVVSREKVLKTLFLENLQPLRTVTYVNLRLRQDGEEDVIRHVAVRESSVPETLKKDFLLGLTGKLETTFGVHDGSAAVAGNELNRTRTVRIGLEVLDDAAVATTPICTRNAAPETKKLNRHSRFPLLPW